MALREKRNPAVVITPNIEGTIEEEKTFFSESAFPWINAPFPHWEREGEKMLTVPTEMHHFYCRIKFYCKTIAEKTLSLSL